MRGMERRLPRKIRATPAWKQFAQAVDAVLGHNNFDPAREIVNLRDPRKIEEYFLPRLANLLGFDMFTDYYDEEQKRQIVAALYEYYEYAGTPQLERFMALCAKYILRLNPMWTRDYVNFERYPNGPTIYEDPENGEWFLTPHIEMYTNGLESYELIERNLTGQLGTPQSTLGEGLYLGSAPFLDRSFEDLVYPQFIQDLFYDLAPVHLVLERITRGYVWEGDTYWCGGIGTLITGAPDDTIYPPQELPGPEPGEGNYYIIHPATADTDPDYVPEGYSIYAAPDSAVAQMLGLPSGMELGSVEQVGLAGMPLESVISMRGEATAATQAFTMLSIHAPGSNRLNYKISQPDGTTDVLGPVRALYWNNYGSETEIMATVLDSDAGGLDLINGPYRVDIDPDTPPLTTPPGFDYSWDITVDYINYAPGNTVGGFMVSPPYTNPSTRFFRPGGAADGGSITPHFETPEIALASIMLYYSPSGDPNIRNISGLYFYGTSLMAYESGEIVGTAYINGNLDYPIQVYRDYYDPGSNNTVGAATSGTSISMDSSHPLWSAVEVGQVLNVSLVLA